MSNLPSTRRHFFQAGLGAISGIAAVRAAAADAGDYIDAHVHVWTPDVDRYPLDAAFDVSDMQPASFTPQELFAHCRPVGVTRIVLIQMSFYNLDNSYMLDVIARHPGVFSGVAIVDHEADRLEANVKSLAERGVRGFRLHARGDAARGWVDHPGMAQLWRIAASENLCVCPLINPTDLPPVDRLCSQFPETRVVIDHFARIGIAGEIDARQLEDLCRLARFPNVYVKTSAFYALGRKQPPYTDLLPMLRRLVDSYGPQRLMWASDCPYQVQGIHSYESSLGLIRDASSEILSAADKRWLLRDTAEQVYFA